MRGKAPKGLRVNKPRQVVRTDMPVAPATGGLNAAFDFEYIDDSIRLKLTIGDRMRAHLKEALDYSAHMYSVPDMKKHSELMVEKVFTSDYLTKRNIGWLGEMLWHASSDFHCPQHKAAGKYFKLFCQTADEFHKEYEKQGSGVKRQELIDLFLGVEFSAQSLSNELENKLEKEMLAESYDVRAPYHKANIAVERIQISLDEIQNSYFHCGFEPNMEHLGWMALSYTKDGTWDAEGMVASAVSQNNMSMPEMDLTIVSDFQRILQEAKETISVLDLPSGNKFLLDSRRYEQLLQKLLNRNE